MSRLTRALALAVLASAGAALAARSLRLSSPVHGSARERLLEELTEEAAGITVHPPVPGKSRFVKVDTVARGYSNRAAALNARFMFLEADPFAVGVTIANDVPFVVSRWVLVSALAGERPLGLKVLVHREEDYLVFTFPSRDGTAPARVVVPVAAIRLLLVTSLALVPAGQERIDWAAEEANLGLAPGTFTDDAGRLA